MRATTSWISPSVKGLRTHGPPLIAVGSRERSYDVTTLWLYRTAPRRAPPSVAMKPILETAIPLAIMMRRRRPTGRAGLAKLARRRRSTGQPLEVVKGVVRNSEHLRPIIRPSDEVAEQLTRARMRPRAALLPHLNIAVLS